MSSEAALMQMRSILSPSPLTPPAETSPATLVNTAVLMLRSQSLALAFLTERYLGDSDTQTQFVSSIQHMYNSLMSGGKIVLSGMGKSYKIGDKLAATMNSLGIHAVCLHPCDALHGDLGILRPADVLVMITASGNTPELLQLMPHLPTNMTRICLTCKPESTLARMSSAVLSAELPEELTEKAIYGLPAPTTTTTACLAVGDAVCLALAEAITCEQEERKANFGRWHPGGAIGQAYTKESKDAAPVFGDVMLDWAEHVGAVDPQADELALCRAAAGRKWVCIGGEELVRATEAGQADGLLLNDLRRVNVFDTFDESKMIKGEVLLIVKDHAVVGIYEYRS
ncbi:uncharacterized protein V1516DRAFT_620736 [Lipomyces oligophaga]|uniref:uncharacterized protein n=1 Tax=Lipomyces oligophaga TaxID=45792 RepID=UPI0034CF0613